VKFSLNILTLFLRVSSNPPLISETQHIKFLIEMRGE
jgi:hypothetical protein